MDICKSDFNFVNFTDVMDYFKRIINVCKQMNYSEFHSQAFESYYNELQNILAERKIKQ